THRQLLDVSRLAGMAEGATSVLHNVGNVLNSVNVAASTAMECLERSRVTGLPRIIQLLEEHAADLGTFLREDERGRRLPAHPGKLAEHLEEEQRALMKEVSTLQQGVEHMKVVIAMQQAQAKVAGVSEELSLGVLVEETLSFSTVELARAGIEVERSFEPLAPV